MGARIVAVGEAANDAERRVIAHLRDHAPAEWTVLHSVEILHGNRLFEIDLVVVTGHAVYVIDVKGTRGRIEVDGSRWYPAQAGPIPQPGVQVAEQRQAAQDDPGDYTPAAIQALDRRPGRPPGRGRGPAGQHPHAA